MDNTIAGSMKAPHLLVHVVELTSCFVLHVHVAKNGYRLLF